jgi:hypothetical protein
MTKFDVRSALKSAMPDQTKHNGRLAIARRLYRAICAQYPDRLITLCDGDGRVLATFRRASTSAAPGRN